MKSGGSRFYDQSELWRTRRCVPESGFLTTIQNMIEVAKLNAYLWSLADSHVGGRIITHHVKMYCVWLFLRFTVGARPIGTPFGSRS